jgi:hypothetical protein
MNSGTGMGTKREQALHKKTKSTTIVVIFETEKSVPLKDRLRKKDS